MGDRRGQENPLDHPLMHLDSRKVLVVNFLLFDHQSSTYSCPSREGQDDRRRFGSLSSS